MPITTIDQNNPTLQRYGSVPVSADLASQLAQQQQNGAMVGMDPFGGVQVPQEGDSLLDFLANLHFSGQTQLAQQLAEVNGIPNQDLNSILQQINDSTASNPHGLLGAISGIGNTVAENPALLFAAPLAIAGLGGLFGGAGAGGGVGAAEAGGVGGGTIGGTIPAAGYSGLSTLPAGVEIGATAIGAAPGLGGLAAGLGGAAAAAGLSGAGFSGATGGGVAPTSVPDVPNGYSGLSTQPPGDVVTSIGQSAGGGGLGLGSGIGLGVGGGALLGAGLGGGAASVPQGPPESPQGPPEGPPDPKQPGGGLNLAQWLALGGFAADALNGNQDITQTSSRDPPAYLAPYLTQAAGAAQTAYQGGNYVAPVQQSAIDYSQNVLNGNYLNSNPYLDATFNKAAGAVTNAVQSNFGRAGRDVRGPDAAGIASGQYSDLAASIYGGNYQAERDRQQQLVPQANQLGAATNPNQSLDDYIARLTQLGGGYGTTSSRIPTQSNFLGGLAGLATLFGG